MKSLPAKKTNEFMGTDYEMLAKTLIGIKGKKFLSINRLLGTGHAFKVAGTMELHRCGPVRTVSTQSIEAP
jgi:hypothetical protein